MSLLKHRMEEKKPEFGEFVYVFISNTALHHVQCFHWRRRTRSETNHKKLIIKFNCVSFYHLNDKDSGSVNRGEEVINYIRTFILTKMLTKSAAIF